MADETAINKLGEKVDTLNTSVVQLKGEFKTFPRVIGLAVGESQIKHIEDYHRGKTPRSNPPAPRQNYDKKMIFGYMGIIGSLIFIIKELLARL